MGTDGPTADTVAADEGRGQDRAADGTATLSPESLPGEYDAIVPVEQLVHGEYNPRRVAPTAQLRRSIDRDGIRQPLIVRPDETDEVYHITDGWQRYQAATDLGYERLPVVIYEEPLAALQATETASIVREWSTYEWAQYCQTIAAELDATADLEAETTRQVAAAVAGRTARSHETVHRYLAALSLPAAVHPLFDDGPAGTDAQWARLKHYHEDVRQYSGLSWRVAARLGKRFQAGSIDTERATAIAANAVAYEVERALEFVAQAVETPTVPLRTVHERVTQGADGTAYLQVPSVAVSMNDAEKTAMMAHCADHRVALSELVTRQLQQFAADLLNDE